MDRISDEEKHMIYLDPYKCIYTYIYIYEL